MYYVYFIRSRKDKYFYIGSTGDLKNRFREHNNGFVRSTKNRVPFDLVYYEAYSFEKEARKREKNLKLRANALTGLRRRLFLSIK